jgi:type II secretory pathway pseudopilin PulG
MARFRKQRGSTLVLLLGIMATLAILASTLVVVLVNAQGNTARERSQAKSFAVADAALEAAMANLERNWPSPGATPSPFPTASFQDQFKPPAGEAPEYPGPGGASVPDVQVAYSAVPGRTDQWYIVAQAGVLKRASRVRALVQHSSFSPQVPTSYFLASDGALLDSGGGGGVMPKVKIDPADPLDPSSPVPGVDVWGNIDDYGRGIISSDVNAQFNGDPPVTGHDSPKTLEEVFPQAARDDIARYAKSVGRYFDAQNATPGLTPFQTALASLRSQYGGPGLSGLTVVRQTTPETYNFTGGLVLNLPPDPPGILMLEGPIDFHIGGTADFYGLLYLEQATMSAGALTIHGELFSTTDIDFRGTLNMWYSQSVLTGLSSEQWTSTVSMVPNTWRELRPQ